MILTEYEISLLNEMKSNCLNGSIYKDEKAKQKFDLLCVLEEFAIMYYDTHKENESLKRKIDKAKKHLKSNEISYVIELLEGK